MNERLQSTRGTRLSPELASFWSSALRCRICPGLAPHRKFPAAAHGTPRYRFMLIGEAPGRISLDHGRPFSNPRNLTVRRAFARAIAPLTLELEEVCYLTDVVKCWPASPSGANRSPRRSEIRNCVGCHLKIELELIQPELILTFGAVPAAAVLGRPVKLAMIHGRKHRLASGARLVTLMHPSTINVAGMRRVGFRSPAAYEDWLTTLLKGELSGVLPRLRDLR